MFWRQEGVSPWHVMQAGEGVAPGPVTFTHLLACALSQGRGSPRAGTEQDWDRVRPGRRGLWSQSPRTLQEAVPHCPANVGALSLADTDRGSLECTRQDPICLAKVKLLSRVQLFETPWSIANQAPLSMGFSRQECCSGLPFPSQGIFPTQGLNPGLQHCRQTRYSLSHQGSPAKVG